MRLYKAQELAGTQAWGDSVYNSAGDYYQRQKNKWFLSQLLKQESASPLVNWDKADTLPDWFLFEMCLIWLDKFALLKLHTRDSEQRQAVEFGT